MTSEYILLLQENWQVNEITFNTHPYIQTDQVIKKMAKSAKWYKVRNSSKSSIKVIHRSLKGDKYTKLCAGPNRYLNYITLTWHPKNYIQMININIVNNIINKHINNRRNIDYFWYILSLKKLKIITEWYL